MLKVLTRMAVIGCFGFVAYIIYIGWNIVSASGTAVTATTGASTFYGYSWMTANWGYLLIGAVAVTAIAVIVAGRKR